MALLTSSGDPHSRFPKVMVPSANGLTTNSERPSVRYAVRFVLLL